MQRALRLLEAVGEHRDGAPAKQLAREAGLPLPTAYHLLRTLTHEGYLRRENGVFVYGDATQRLGSGSGSTQRTRRDMITDRLEQWRDELGVPVYFGVYRDGEIEVAGYADTPDNPAVEEWADFRETAHAHAIGQCLLGQLGEEVQRDHLDRHPVQPVTPYSVPDGKTLLQRLATHQRMQPVYEKEEYALGTVCAAFPITAGDAAATMAISLPLHQADRLHPVVKQLQKRIGEAVSSLTFSISI